MKLNRLFVVFALQLMLAGILRADSESLASIFTNAPKTRTAIPIRSSIIFIACHGLAYGDLSCYGQTNFQTPNLDRLAAEGMRFTNYRTTGDDLLSGQAALMTGNNSPVAHGQTMVADRLLAAGYHTGLIGEWTLGSQPWTQGFEEFAGFLNEQEADNFYSDFIWRYAPRSVIDETNGTLRTWQGREEIYQNTGTNKTRYIPDVLMVAAENYVRIHQPDYANHFKPFFLLLNLPLPHSIVRGKDEYQVPTDAPFTGENWPQAAKNRAALVTRLDDKIGHLMEQLSKLGMTNNVAIFLGGVVAPEPFASTNMTFLKLKGEVRGGSSPEHLRVPMIVHWPNHVPAGRVSETPWSAPDFAPTALDIAYAKPVASFTGMSVFPLLSGVSQTNAPDAPSKSHTQF